MNRVRLDQELAQRGVTSSRSQAESYIKLGKVKVNGQVVTKPGYFVLNTDRLDLEAGQQFVSRAALKLASVANGFKLDFHDKLVLDVGSSTGGFTEFALLNGAAKVIAVEIGTDQMHPKIKSDSKVELHEKTDIRSFQTDKLPDIILADLSFISLRQILPILAKLSNFSTQIVVMLKPQFETTPKDVQKGVIKNDRLRRQIIKAFEVWLKTGWIIKNKADSQVAGAKGNQERFYLLNRSK